MRTESLFSINNVNKHASALSNAVHDSAPGCVDRLQVRSRFDHFVQHLNMKTQQIQTRHTWLEYLFWLRLKSYNNISPLRCKHDRSFAVIVDRVDICSMAEEYLKQTGINT